MPTTKTHTVPLFGRAVPVPALTLLLRLEDEGYDLRVDATTLPRSARTSRATSRIWC